MTNSAKKYENKGVNKINVLYALFVNAMIADFWKECNA